MNFSAQYAHWHQFFENISISSLTFYKSLEEELATRKIPETASSQVDFLEGGPMSPKRIYLRIRRDWMTFHICVAPFGTGFFVSSRLLVSPWKSWSILAVTAFVLSTALFFSLLILTAIFKNIIFAILIVFVLAIPTAFLFLVVFIVWLILSLRMTYYRQDTMLAFHEAVHGLLVAKVSSYIEASGRKPLTDEEKKPIMHKLLWR